MLRKGVQPARSALGFAALAFIFTANLRDSLGAVITTAFVAIRGANDQEGLDSIRTPQRHTSVTNIEVSV